MKILFTTDFHSNFTNSINCLNECYLKKHFEGALVFDSGDFIAEGAYDHFEGRQEAFKIQNSLFDCICPGNHGFLEAISSNQVVCCNLYHDGKRANESHRFFSKNGVHILVTGVISNEAFESIPVSERDGYSLIDPIFALDKLIKECNYLPPAILIILSHSGIDVDAEMALSLPRDSILLSGHCHSETMLIKKNGIIIAKAPEEGAGFGLLRISATGIQSIDFTFTNSKLNCENPVEELKVLTTKIPNLKFKLAQSIGKMEPKFSKFLGLNYEFINLICQSICNYFNKTTILNKYLFRKIPEKSLMNIEDLLNFLPFDNSLIIVRDITYISKLESLVHKDLDSFIICTSETSRKSTEIITTDYLMAKIIPDGCDKEVVVQFRDLVSYLMCNKEDIII